MPVTPSRKSYDFRTHRRTPATRTVRPGRHLLVEGILALCWSAIRTLCDTTVFIVEPAARFADVTVDGGAPIDAGVEALLAHLQAGRRGGRDPGGCGLLPGVSTGRGHPPTAGSLTAKRNMICCLPCEGGVVASSRRR